MSLQRTVLLLVMLVLNLPNLSRADDVIVTLVEVQGNRRIEAATVLAKIKTREGSVFSPSQLKDDIRALYQLGHFEDVQVRTEGFEKGVKVIFWVKEKPLIREISFEGNAAISTDILKEKITLLPRTAFNLPLIQENADKVRRKYQEDGYYNAIVVPVISELRGGDKNVVFYIEEGDKYRLTNVVVTGNKAITADEIKSVMKNQEWWLLSLFGESGTLRPELLAEDVEAVRNLYYNRGYIQVQVDAPVVEEHPFTEHTHEFLGQTETYVTRNEITLRISVKEGEQYRVSGVTVKGNTLIPTDDLLGEIKLKRDDVFSRDVLREDVARIMDRYDSMARPFASVTPQFAIDDEKRTVAIQVEVQEGGEVRIGRIDITGNSKTRDKVVRREMRLDEGDLYSKTALRRSYERINNLNFFETIEFAPERRLQEPVMDLNIKVKEKMTGSLSVGGGYSSVDKLMAVAEVTQGNLGGRGQLLKFKMQWGKTRKTYVATFREPYLFDKPVWGQTDVYRQDVDYDGYSLKTEGFALSIGKSFTEYVSASLKYGYDTQEVYNKTTVPLLLQQQTDSYGKDKLRTSAVTATLARDSRDFYLDPSKGSRNVVSFTYAGGSLGGDPEYIKYTGDSAWYFPLFWDTVFMVRGRAGFTDSLIENPLPTSERFFVGGAGTVRGYRSGTAGPVDAAQNRLGGNRQIIFNAEYTFPIVPAARLKGVLFYDMGRGFNDGEHIDPGHLHLRHSYGWGFWWLSPLGPLRFEWGYIRNQRPTDQREAFEFSIGTIF